MKKDKVILVTGGTGGHIIPAVALYEEMKKKNYNPFLVVDERFLQFTKYFDKNLKYKVIASDRFSGSIVQKLLGIFKLYFGFLQAIILIIKEKPKLLIGFGGYTTFPTLMAAKFLRKPVLIHEQNSVLGNANKILANGIADLALTAFPEVKNLSKKTKVKYVGNFVRKNIRECKTSLPKINDGVITFTVLGGSQGASILSDVVPEALLEFSKMSKFKIRVFHQARSTDLEKVASFYRLNKIECEVKEFFDDVADKILKSNLVISRSGASTITDLTFLGRTAILVPIPDSFKNHQLLNSRFLESNKAAWVIEQKNFNVKSLANCLNKIFKDKKLLENYSSNILKLKKNGFDSIFSIIKNYCAN